jgi:hypothetical protein
VRGEVPAGLDQHSAQSLALGGEHVGFDVIIHHHGTVGVGAQAGQSGGKERPAVNSAHRSTFLALPAADPDVHPERGDA